MSKELTTTNTHEMLHTLRATIAPGLTDSEFLLFAEIVKNTGLNPVTKEVWAIKAGGRLQIMTGINGFLKIANVHPAFDGMEVNHEWDGKTLVSCTVKVHRKDRQFPSIATAYMAEYSKPTPIWKQMPSVMLAKCAKSLAIREAFINELGGLYTQEEMPSEYSQASQERAATKVEFVADDQVIKGKNGQVIGIQFQPVSTDDTGKLKVKAQRTVYDIRALSEEHQAKAADYLRERLAVYDGEQGVWVSPIRLEKLQSCIVTESEDAL